MNSSTTATRITIIDRLRERIKEARSMGFQIRNEMLASQTGGWCEIAGKKIVFLDSALSAAEQLETLDQAIADYRPRS